MPGAAQQPGQPTGRTQRSQPSSGNHGTVQEAIDLKPAKGAPAGHRGH